MKPTSRSHRLPGIRSKNHELLSAASGVEWVKEAFVQRCSVKKVFIEILQNLQDNTCIRVYFLIKLQALVETSQNSQENTCARVSFWIKLQALRLCLTLAHVFSYEFCGISNNTFFYRTPLVAASKFVNLNNEKITAQIVTQQ